MRRPLNLLPVVLLGIPIAEIAVFILVGREIGVAATLALVVVTALVGMALLRRQGLGLLVEMRRELDAGRVPARTLAHGVMVMAAGVLLLIPGFITDALGLLLLAPVVRDRLWRWLMPRIPHGRTFGRSAASRVRRPVIELEAEDGRTEPRPDSPWRPPADSG